MTKKNLRKIWDEIGIFWRRGGRFLDRHTRSLRTWLPMFFQRIRLKAEQERLKKIASVEQRGVGAADAASASLRKEIRKLAGLDPVDAPSRDEDDILREFSFLLKNADIISTLFQASRGKRVLYVGQAYYNSFYLSRALRMKGWKADLLDWDLNLSAKKFYHGSDVEFMPGEPYDYLRDLNFYMSSLYSYDVFHFANAHAMSYGASNIWFTKHFGENSEIRLLKALGKTIVYSNSGCNDGVTQTSFSSWGPVSPCSECVWQGQNEVCGDVRNASWGHFRNEMADHQCLLGGNRIDYNISATIHEEPEFYCLSPEIWDPSLDIPEEYRLPEKRPGEVRVYHAVGNRKTRTRADGTNIKSTHVYLPLLEKMAARGFDLELVSPDEVPNLDVRYLQLQSDIFLEMLTFGWFGANAREAMMLGKPVICYIRPEWLQSLREEIPEYAEELPIVSATPQTVEKVLEDLIVNPLKREEIGRRSREFALKWHSDTAGARRFDQVYSRLLWPDGQPIGARPKTEKL